MPFKGSTILTSQKFSTYYLVLINCEMHSEPILYASMLSGSAIFRSLSQQVHHLRKIHICRLWGCLKLTSLGDASDDVGSPTFRQVFYAQIKEDWGHNVCGLLLRYDHNALHNSIFIKLQNRLLYYHQLFHCRTSDERLGLNCKGEYTNANQGIMPESNNICVQYTNSDLDHTFEGCVPSFPAVFCSWTPPNQILRFQLCLPAGKTISTILKWCKKTQQSILRPQAQEYAVVIPTLYQDLNGWPDCVDRFIWVVKQSDMMHIVPVEAIVGLA